MPTEGQHLPLVWHLGSLQSQGPVDTEESGWFVFAPAPSLLPQRVWSKPGRWLQSSHSRDGRSREIRDCKKVFIPYLRG